MPRRIVVSRYLGVGASFEVTHVGYHPNLEVTLLHVPLLRAQPLDFEDTSERGQPVYLPLKENEVFRWGNGSIQSIETLPVLAYGGVDQDFIEHTADLFAPENYGAPLLSEEGAVLGINHRNPDVLREALTSNSRPVRPTFAIPSADLTAFLQSSRVTLYQAPPTAELDELQVQLDQERERREEAQRLADEERERAEEMERRAQEASTASEREREAAEAAAQEAEARADEAERLLLEAAELVRQTEERLAEERTQAAESTAVDRRNLYIAGIAGALTVTLLAAWFFGYARRSSSRMRRARARLGEAEYDARQARADAAKAHKPAPFGCLMEGRSPGGRSYTLKIAANLLGAPEGVVIGRNPEYAALVVDHKGISRQHARFSVEDGTLYIEDLNSTNGSFVNDLRLTRNQTTPLRLGETVRLGPIRFKLSLTQA